MKWNRKYNYPTSTRAILNGKRHYNVNNEKLPSVTTILKETESIEKKENLAKWREKVGYKQAELITREATNRGSNLHHYLEMFLLGKLNLDLLGDNTREKVMADQIIENGYHVLELFRLVGDFRKGIVNILEGEIALLPG